MKKLLLLLTLGFVLFSCKKTKDPDPIIYYDGEYQFDPTFQGSDIIYLRQGDTAYVGFNVLIKKGNASELSLNCTTNDSNFRAYISQDKGVPPFYFSVMLVASNTAPTLSSYQFNIMACTKKDTIYGGYFLALIDTSFIPPPDTSCIADLIGNLHADSAQSHFMVTITSGGGGSIFLQNVDGLGSTVKAYVSCPNWTYIIPFQRLRNGVFIESRSEYFSSGLSYTTTDSAGNVVDHHYSLNP
ncbi:MAG: hypothetical protein BGO69_00585 [Bacteroidetes bacterium 46-16]|nr:MAG: hypothetical protein BGO69_00585 [Bacteroidetes bacterium 46-16]